jgi:hypothetical protein
MKTSMFSVTAKVRPTGFPPIAQILPRAIKRRLSRCGYNSPWHQYSNLRVSRINGKEFYHKGHKVHKGGKSLDFVGFPFVTVASFVFEKWHPVKNGRVTSSLRTLAVQACTSFAFSSGVYHVGGVSFGFGWHITFYRSCPFCQSNLWWLMYDFCADGREHPLRANVFARFS